MAGSTGRATDSDAARAQGAAAERSAVRPAGGGVREGVPAERDRAGLPAGQDRAPGDRAGSTTDGEAAAGRAAGAEAERALPSDACVRTGSSAVRRGNLPARCPGDADGANGSRHADGSCWTDGA